MFYCFNLSTSRIFVKVLIERNINISNELNFSDVFQSANYIGLIASKVYVNSVGFIHFACDPM